MLTIETWDGNNINDGTNYKAGFSPAVVWGLPDVEVTSIARPGAWPSITGITRGPKSFSIFIAIQDNTSIRTLRNQLLSWFDPEDEESKKLIIADDSSSTNQRFVYAICTKFRPVIIGDVAARDLFRAELVIDGDVRWRSESETTETTWSVGASGATNTYNNTGDDDAYPVYEIEPTSNKTGGFSYKRYVHVEWKNTLLSSNGLGYPIRLGPLDTDALVTAGKMQADGDDLRVYVDGEEVAIELVDINTASTYIWMLGVSWKRAPTLELEASIAGAGTVDSIQLDDEVEMSLLPGAGYVKIGSEVFGYSNRDLLNKRLTGIERAIWDTTAGAHSAGDDVDWLQHEVIIQYGNASLTAPSYDRALAFDADTSDNDTWTYTDFNVLGTEEDAEWSFANGEYRVWGEYGLYGGTELSWPTTCAVIGAWKDDNEDTAVGWFIYCPSGIESIAWSSGKTYAVTTADFNSKIFGWSEQGPVQVTTFGITSPGAASTWTAWSATSDFEAENGVVDRAGFYLFSSNSRFEVGGAVVELETDRVPTQSIQSEEGNYTLDLELENETTGEIMYVNLEMATNEVLEIDTYNKTVTYKANESNQFQAVSLDTARIHWLRLQPGNNTLKFTDTGTNDVDVDVSYRTRSY